MWKITRRDIWAHKFRFLLTVLAVVLGVAFVVGTFVIRDGLKETFSDLVADINSDIDVQVRGAADFEEIQFDDPPPIPGTLVDEMRAVDGVREAEPTVGGVGVIPIKSDGEPLESFGPPILAFNYTDSVLSPTTLAAGEPPGPGEFLIDVDTAENDGFEIGDTYEIVGNEGREPFTLAGTFVFGEDNALVGAKLQLFEITDLQRLLDRDGLVNSIEIAAEPGVAVGDLVETLNASLPDRVEAVSQQTVIQEGEDDFNFFIDLIGNALLGFALVALFVAAFLINNIFAITVGQRVRELGLLRAVGASSRQVRLSVLAQALIIGVVATIVGLGAGVLIGIAIRALLDALDFGLPAYPVGLAPATIGIGAAIGIGVTLLASISPARRASKVPPVVAMRSDYRLGEGEGRRRTIIGAIFAVVGVVLLLTGLFGDPPNAAALLFNLGAGAVGIFIGVTLLSPLFAAPVARAIGAVVTVTSRLKPRHLGRVGPSSRLATENAARNTRTSAATAGAIMIGLALVTMAGVFGQSLKDTFDDTLSNSAEADFYVTEFTVGFSPQVAERLDASGDFDRVSGYRAGRARIDGATKDITAMRLDQLDGLLDFGIMSGSLDGDPSGMIAVHEDPAGDLDLAVGDPLTMEFANGSTADLTVAAIYDDATIVQNWLIDISLWDEHFTSDDDFLVAVRIADGVSEEQARTALDAVADDFPQVTIENQEEFRESQSSQIDSLIAVINALLGLALVIALLGIAITMALAVFERTREIGLLRAVGMKRSQAATMVVGESVIVSVFGAVLGIVLGLLFGYAAVSAVPDSVVSTFAVPWGSLVVYIVLAAVAGVLAGLFPAWRAGRLDVLDAIANE